jgi:hypothetical protein
VLKVQLNDKVVVHTKLSKTENVIDLLCTVLKVISYSVKQIVICTVDLLYYVSKLYY